MDEFPEHDRFQSLFSPDPARAQEEFALLVCKLQKYFGWRCQSDPEELASQTISRAIKRIAEGAIVPDITTFCYGIAANIKKEEWKKRHEDEIKSEPGGPEPILFGMQSSEQAVLVNQCLATIPPTTRSLLKEYYWGDREQLAQAQGLTQNALRIRIFRAIQEIRARVAGKASQPGA